MPGTPEQYQEAPDTAQAAQVIDGAISDGKGGQQIIDDLMGQGFRLYTEGAMAMEGSEEAMEEGMEGAAEGEALAEDFLGGGPIEEGDMDLPFPPVEEAPGGPDGGMRGMRIDAVRFALDKDKKKKGGKKGNSDEEKEAEY